MKNKNILFNHTLNEYKNKYKHLRKYLHIMPKKQVEEFDRAHGYDRQKETKNYLLKDRRWWLIDNTYYEVPSGSIKSWIKNLKVGTKIALSCALLGGTATGIIVPIVLANVNNIPVTIDKAYKNEVVFEKNVDSKGLSIVLKTTNEELIVNDVFKVQIEGVNLVKDVDYTFDKSLNKVFIPKNVLDAHPGIITITPTLLTYGITILDKDVVMSVNSQKKLSVCVSPLDAYVNWTSSNIEIASVKEGGVVTTYKAGDIVITATVKNKKAFINLKVKQPTSSCVSSERIEGAAEDAAKILGIPPIDGEIVIPEIINGQKIIELVSGNCEGKKAISSVVIPDAVTKISDGGLYNCLSIKEINLPSSLEYIGDEAFTYRKENNNYNLLETIHIPEKVIHIGKNAFNFCYNLKTVILDSAYAANLKENDETTNTNIFDSAGLVYVREDIILKEDSFIAKYYHKETTSDKPGYIKYVYSEKYICEPIDENTCILTPTQGVFGDVEIPETFTKNGVTYKVTKLGLFNNSNPVLLRFTSSIEGFTYLNLALNYVKTLRTIIVDSQSIANIGSQMGFNLFCDVEDIYVNNKLEQPVSGTEIFDKYEKTESSNLEGYTHYKNIDVYFSDFDDMNNTCSLAGATGSNTKIKVPKTFKGYTVTKIRPSAFNYTYISSLDLSETLITEIPVGAFQICELLRELILPITEVNVYLGSFSGQENLNRVIINNEVTAQRTSIQGYGEFMNYASCVLVNDKIALNEDSYIYNNYDFEDFEEVGGISYKRYIAKKYTISNIDEDKKTCQFNGSVLNFDFKLVVPEKVGDYTVTSLGNLSPYVENVDMSNAHIKTIPTSGFRGNSNVLRVKFSEELETINVNAFYGCKLLDDINIPSNFKSIKTSAFSGCKNLKTITVNNEYAANLGYNSKTLTSIGSLYDNAETVYVTKNVVTIKSSSYLSKFFQIDSTGEQKEGYNKYTRIPN